MTQATYSPLIEFNEISLCGIGLDYSNYIEYPDKSSTSYCEFNYYANDTDK